MARDPGKYYFRGNIKISMGLHKVCAGLHEVCGGLHEICVGLHEICAGNIRKHKNREIYKKSGNGK